LWYEHIYQWELVMVRLAIIDQNGNPVLPKDIPTATELRQAADQARDLIRECERLAQQKAQKDPSPAARRVPYT
jgi:hypothetical protein